MKTIFVDGGEYVDKATYIALRDESEKMRVRALDAEARVRELEAGIASLERDVKHLQQSLNRGS